MLIANKNLISVNVVYKERAISCHFSGRAEHPLDLVHSYVCGKIGARSLGGGEYFVTFLDDCTRYVWVYIVKHKGEVFQKFREWKTLVENSSGRKVKILRSDNGGEYTCTSNELVEYLTQEGIKHELTIPHTPQQNGAAERLNRTLMEGVHTMLADSKLPMAFGLRRCRHMCTYGIVVQLMRSLELPNMKHGVVLSQM